MSKVLVDRELLEQTVKHLEWDGDGSQTVMQYAQQGDRLAEELAEAIAQPAEAEGADVRKIVVDSLVGMIAGVTRMIPPADQPLPDFIQAPVDRAVERINAALSAVTAERDRLRKDAERWRYVSLQGDDTHWLNLLRVDLEDFGGNINAAVDALIDGEAPAMAAKEAGPEHVCSGCGAKGWTGNCLECIPY